MCVFGNRVFIDATRSERGGFGWKLAQYADVFRRRRNLEALVYTSRPKNKIQQLFL